MKNNHCIRNYKQLTKFNLQWTKSIVYSLLFAVYFQLSFIVLYFKLSKYGIYLEKSFENFDIEFERLSNAKKLVEESLMFLVHPTISFISMEEYAKTIKKILLMATK